MCFSFDSLNCCGHRQPLAYVIPYATTWSPDPDLVSRLSHYRGLRLMGKPKVPAESIRQSILHAESLYLSRAKGFKSDYFESFADLLALELDYCPIVDLSCLGSAPRLRYLRLTECRGLVNLEGLNRLPSLACLRIAICNRISTYKPLSEATGLEWLAIESKLVDELRFLESLPRLKSLSLSVTKVENTTSVDLEKPSSLNQVSLPSKRWAKNFAARLAALPGCEVEWF